MVGGAAQRALRRLHVPRSFLSRWESDIGSPDGMVYLERQDGADCSILELWSRQAWNQILALRCIEVAPG